MGAPYIGEIKLFAYPISLMSDDGPVWLLCDGTELKIQQFPALYAAIGAVYGGDGQSTFALPDLRGRVPLCVGVDRWQNNNVIGTKGGVETVVLTEAQIPAHSHLLQVSRSNATAATPANNMLAAAAADATNVTPNLYAPYASTNGVALDSKAVKSVGGGQGHNNIQPSMVLGFYICVLGGTFPVRPQF